MVIANVERINVYIYIYFQSILPFFVNIISVYCFHGRELLSYRKIMGKNNDYFVITAGKWLKWGYCKHLHF